MKKESKKLPQGLLEYTVELSAEEMKPYFDHVFEEMAVNLKIDGFRPGKVPTETAKRHINEAKILEETAERAINEKYQEIMLADKIVPAGLPEVHIQKIAKDNPFIFKFTVPLLPKVKLGDHRKIKIKKEKVEVMDGQVEKVLNDLQKMRRTEVVVDRAIGPTDKAEVDIEMSLNKVVLENGVAKNTAVVMDEPFYIPGFAEKILGVKKGEIKEFSLKYPEDHYDKKLAGREIDFKVKINNVYEIKLPELNDEFVKTLGNFPDLSALKEQIKKNLIEEQELKADEKAELEILKQLIEVSEFEEVPEILVKRETEIMLNEIESFLSQQNLRLNDYLEHLKKTKESMGQELAPKALERVKTSLALRELAQAQEVVVTDEEAAKEIEKSVVMYANDPKTLEKLNSESYKNYVRQMMTTRKVIENLKKDTLKENK